MFIMFISFYFHEPLVHSNSRDFHFCFKLTSKGANTQIISSCCELLAYIERELQHYKITLWVCRNTQPPKPSVSYN